jgi:hypothetical protein
MLSEKDRHIGSGEINLKTHQSVIVVVDFVEDVLKKLAKNKEYQRIENEKGLTQKLVILLNHGKNCFPFYFHHEYIENTEKGNSPAVDIGTISTSSYCDRSFFSIEAKRLPAPSKNREKEYVCGKGGGIERFKKEIHGKGLAFCAILGYVQKNDFGHWFNSINEWINEIKWNEKLEKVSKTKTTARYLSRHKRSIDEITLFHLWVKLNKKI